ncbi:Sensor kinase CusS [Pelotomaculum schinkii]|uniref:histidine kinase n=1 Tax=Pelotomaculum schinkii TaxID=78350 RepID=A0A4Y7RAM9_9FIRM|nr:MULTISPECIES: HAMP domain-containing sensor histidine kinase [Pelotomaculum]TEB06038.1 Sensor kinase CusS [Pelotomaculum schinkii]TEB15849.1 Sensor kinase CusS [Pelotomaculum sp. FP]
MIRKLRRKFIFINMTLISLVLIIVFASICFFSYQRTKAESYDVMQRVINSDIGMPPPPVEIGNRHPKKAMPMLPVFSALLDDQGKIISAARENVAVSDEMIAEVSERVLASGRQEGILYDQRLRFLLKHTPEGVRITFADMTRELEAMTNLMITLLLVGAGGLAAFFLISLFLSGWALNPVEKAWEQQRRFVADASHELKTPLTVILANTGILLAHRQDTIDRQSKWVEYTQAEANRMKKLVDDLLFLAKSDAAEAPALQTSMNFSDVVWSCFLHFESVAYEQGIIIKSEIAPDITLTGDEGQLNQLAVILLDNACKYAGKSGTVTLTLKRLQESVLLTVSNTGAPIPVEHLNHIFERFYRSDSSRSREQGGYGLGLAIAKAIVENHRGRISVESSEKAGTTFSVNFPLK